MLLDSALKCASFSYLTGFVIKIMLHGLLLLSIGGTMLNGEYSNYGNLDDLRIG